MIVCKNTLMLSTQLFTSLLPLLPIPNLINSLHLIPINLHNNRLTLPQNPQFTHIQRLVSKTPNNHQPLIQKGQNSSSQTYIKHKPNLYKKFRFTNYQRPTQQATHKQQPALQTTNSAPCIIHDNKRLTLTPRFRFANYQKPSPQTIKKQQPKQQSNNNPPPAPPLTSQQSSESKPLYTARDMFVIMMSIVGGFLWVQVLLKQYLKKQNPIPVQPVIIQKVIEKELAKQEEQESMGLVFLLFLMCVFMIAAEFWRMRNFEKIYEELRVMHKVLKEEVHGIQLQLIRERLGFQ